MAFDITKGMSRIGWVTSSGETRGNVNVVRSIDRDGNANVEGNGVLGWVSTDGTVHASERGRIGHVTADGRVFGPSGQVGWVDPSGVVQSLNGQWGWVSDDRMTRAEVPIVYAGGAALLLVRSPGDPR